jgi:hypothetical protein
LVDTYGGKVRSGARREVEPGLTAFVGSFEFCYKFLGRAALGGILRLLWGGFFRAEF